MKMDEVGSHPVGIGMNPTNQRRICGIRQISGDYLEIDMSREIRAQAFCRVQTGQLRPVCERVN